MPKIVIATTPGRQQPALEVNGRTASIREAIETAQVIEAKLKMMVDQSVLACGEAAEIFLDPPYHKPATRIKVDAKLTKAADMMHSF